MVFLVYVDVETADHETAPCKTHSTGHALKLRTPCIHRNRKGEKFKILFHSLLSGTVVLCQVYHNFGLPHGSLRQALAAPMPTHGTGSAKGWRPCTPAMAAGLTDHVWSLREVLRLRVPPWPQPQTV